MVIRLGIAPAAHRRPASGAFGIGHSGWIALALATLLVLLAGVGVYRQNRWKRFGVVEPGRLYRSGALTPGQLGAAIDKLGLQTVVCLASDLAESDQQVCAERGIRCVVVAMPDDGLGTAAQFAEFLDLTEDERSWPILVHCRAGVARTGAAVALFRIQAHGWSAEAALEELRSFERRGRCEPALEQHIRRLKAERVLPASAAR